MSDSSSSSSLSSPAVTRQNNNLVSNQETGATHHGASSLHRPQLGHLPPAPRHPPLASANPTNRDEYHQNNNNNNHNQNTLNTRPPLFSNIPSFAVTTMPGTSAHMRQKQQGNIPPRFVVPGEGAQPFPAFTQDQKLVDGFGQSDEGTMNFLLGESNHSSSSSSNEKDHATRKNTHRQNGAFEFYLNFVDGDKSPSRTSQDSSSSSNKVKSNDDHDHSPGATAAWSSSQVNKFFVRLWGPKYLFSQQPSDHVNAEAVLAAIRQKILHHHHRLVVLLHGAGMSSMGFHLVACQMLGIDPSDSFITVDENDIALLNPEIIQGAGDSEDDSAKKPPLENTRTVPSTVMVSSSSSTTTTPNTSPQPIFVSFDYRGHGKTKMAAKNPSYDLDSLAHDVTTIIQRMFDIGSSLKQRVSVSAARAETDSSLSSSSSSSSSSEKLFWAPDQSVCLIGHSVGGSVASAVSEMPEWRQRLFGLVLLDIVEGTALESIRHMPDFLKRRPQTFSSEAEAIQWFVRFGGMRDPDSAAISVPTLLKKTTTIGDGEQHQGGQEVKKLDQDAAKADIMLKKFEWITDLAKTEPYWNTWFHGMDGRFLHALCPRMLCLSSRDTLDKDLTVAHMQGQFQLEIFRDCGHYLMEDQPHMLAPVLMRFISRVEQQNEKLKAVFMKKFGASGINNNNNNSNGNNNQNSSGSFQGGGSGYPASMSHMGKVNPHANLGTPSSTIIPTFYTPSPK